MNAALAVRVTTGGGTPCDDAVLTLVSMTGEQIARVEADAEGAVQVDAAEPGTYTMVITAPGFNPEARVAVVSSSGTTRLGSVTLTRVGAAPVPAAGLWTIDPSHSTIAISVRHLGISTVKGRFRDFAGQIEVPENFEHSRMSAVITTASIDTDNRMRDDILRSGAFFDIESYPQANFTGTSISRQPDETWSLRGELTIRGAAAPVDLTLTYLGQTDDPWGGTRAGFRASGELKRSDFGLRFDEKLVSGVAQIGSSVRVDLDIQVVRDGNAADT